MKRREFLAKSAAAATANAWMTRQSAAQTTETAASTREYYLLRRYQLARSQAAGCDHYLGEVLLPALHRHGFKDIGAFGLDYGPQTPETYLLLRHTDAMQLVQLEETLDADTAFVKAAESFRGAAAAKPGL